jgi:hypothetical protein
MLYRDANMPKRIWFYLCVISDIERPDEVEGYVLEM